MRVLPPLAQRIYSGAFAVAFSTLFVLNAPSSLRHAGALVPEVLLLACDVACIRALRLAVIAGEDALVVRNYLRTYRLGWDEVAGFKLEPPATRLVGWELKLAMRSGKSAGLDATKRLLRRGDDQDRSALEGTRRRLQAWVP